MSPPVYSSTILMCFCQPFHSQKSVTHSVFRSESELIGDERDFFIVVRGGIFEVDLQVVNSSELTLLSLFWAERKWRSAGMIACNTNLLSRHSDKKSLLNFWPRWWDMYNQGCKLWEDKLKSNNQYQINFQCFFAYSTKKLKTKSFSQNW